MPHKVPMQKYQRRAINAQSEFALGIFDQALPILSSNDRTNLPER
jgi:hypothetical protein